MSITKAMGCARETPMKRKASDFYATPADCTIALLREEIEEIRPLGRVWEPACGDGAIVRVLQAAGLPVVASDIMDRGCPDVTLKNFLDFDEPLARAIVTNPPYGSRAPEKFVRHALRLGCVYVALFLKANYWNAAERLRLHSDWRPVCYYPVAWRPDFTGDGAPTMDMAWYVWDARRSGQVFKPLRRPTNESLVSEDKPAEAPLLAWGHA